MLCENQSLQFQFTKRKQKQSMPCNTKAARRFIFTGTIRTFIFYLCKEHAGNLKNIEAVSLMLRGKRLDIQNLQKQKTLTEEEKHENNSVLVL